VLAAALKYLALIAGFVGTTWGLIGAKAAADAEKLARERAEANFLLAKESVEKYLVTVTDDPDLKKADFNNLRKKLLEAAIPFFQRIAEQKSNDPEVEATRGQAYLRLGSVRRVMGENEAAIQDYEAMREIYARLAADTPAAPDYRQELARCHNNLGTLLKDLGKREEAEAAYRQAVRIQAKLAADHPAVAAYRQALALSHNNLGALLKDLGKSGETEAAEAAFRQALDIQENLVAGSPPFRNTAATWP